MVIWDGKPRLVNVQALGDHTLIGMRMLVSHNLKIGVKDGGPVSIEPIP
jgi:hypothetical protein